MKIFSVLLILMSGFIFNIGVYYISEDYRMFLKSLKSDTQDIEVSDEYRVTVEEDPQKTDTSPSLEEELNQPLVSGNIGNKNVDDGGAVLQKINYYSDDKKSVKMSEYDKQVLSLFSYYQLVELQSHSILLDVNSEYPDEYFEYYSPELTVLFFPTKSYDEVKEIFEIVSDGGNYTVNEVDNFGDESLYVNLDEDYDDGAIRIIFTQQERTFGLKISKNEYNRVKEILKNL